jgi:hypothetical protein
MSAFFQLLTFTGAVSPELKAEIHQAIDNLLAKAKATPNPIDDVAIVALRTLLSIIGLY